MTVQIHGLDWEAAPEDAKCTFCGHTHETAKEEDAQLFIVEDVQWIPEVEKEFVKKVVTCTSCTDVDPDQGSDPDDGWCDTYTRRAEAGFSE